MKNVGKLILSSFLVSSTVFYSNNVNSENKITSGNSNCSVKTFLFEDKNLIAQSNTDLKDFLRELNKVRKRRKRINALQLNAQCIGILNGLADNYNKCVERANGGEASRQGCANLIAKKIEDFACRAGCDCEPIIFLHEKTCASRARMNHGLGLS